MSYPGGKNGAGVYQAIINQMPPHEVYIEAFLGGGAIMRNKKPARLNIGLDRDEEAIQSFPVTFASSCGVPGHIAVSDDAADTARNDEDRFRFLVEDAITYLQNYDFKGGELVYCDPPYMRHTRTERDLYRFEMDDEQHKALLNVLCQLPCMVMVSGYWSQLYADQLKGWHSVQFQAMTRGGTQATEWLWMNFAPPVELHDYSFLGSNFRERERIKRKKARWTARLEKLPLLERQALLAAISEVGLSPAASPKTARSDS